MIEAAKRVLRPARPLLMPVWRRLAPLVEGGGVIGAGRDVLARARDRRRGGGGSATGIRPLRSYELGALARRSAYYRGRRGYLTVAAAIAGELIDRDRLQTALELGPHTHPLIVGSDVMDLDARAARDASIRVIVHNATRTPWPVPDESYGLFVALQVFEHLKGRQPEAFAEVRRVARHAIISLPIDWQLDDPTNCHHGITREQALAWFAPVVPTRIVVGNGGPRTRLMFVFEDLAAPDPDAAADGAAGPAGVLPEAVTA